MTTAAEEGAAAPAPTSDRAHVAEGVVDDSAEESADEVITVPIRQCLQTGNRDNNGTEKDSGNTPRDGLPTDLTPTCNTKPGAFGRAFGWVRRHPRIALGIAVVATSGFAAGAAVAVGSHCRRR